MMRVAKDQAKAVAVLTSGGVESAALVSEALERYERVYPIYVRKGLRWEKAELVHLRKLLAALRRDGLAKLTVLEVPLRPIYGRHWSLGRLNPPGAKAPDEAVYLPGRNLLLIGLAGLFCGTRRISTLWVGILQGNPFQDARSGFFRQMESLLEESLSVTLRIVAPFRELTKVQVIRRKATLSWEKTFSCLKPIKNQHCGRCQKCGERMAGFKAAGVKDPTRYAR